MNDVRERRILSLDGGGIRGAFSAAFLATLERSIDRPLGEYFDLIAGTSTGGIIALALAFGLPAARIVDLYATMGRAVFGKRDLLFGWVRPKYDSQALRNVLEEIFGDATLADSKTRVVIPAYDVDAKAGVLMKTPHCTEYAKDGKRRLVDVALATAAAPTYFPIATDDHQRRLIDGGMFANNPSVLAVVEAVFKLHWPADGIRVLSVGTTRPSRTILMSHSGGLWGWRKHIIDIFTDSQSWMATGVVSLALGPAHVVRIDPELHHRGFSLDDISSVPTLVALGQTTAEQRAAELLPAFLNREAEVWRRSNGAAVPLLASAV